MSRLCRARTGEEHQGRNCDDRGRAVSKLPHDETFRVHTSPSHPVGLDTNRAVKII
ncbi:hypothetical protein [Rhodococcus sp. T7]|uniref:hypothetical protein n=1 Tax=Rhodococcus sp. T7 TaxID=627444 RepID=UPI001358E699|nr:hypothetical protein [Rhodococcus sp. T7]